MCGSFYASEQNCISANHMELISSRTPTQQTLLGFRAVCVFFGCCGGDSVHHCCAVHACCMACFHSLIQRVHSVILCLCVVCQHYRFIPVSCFCVKLKTGACSLPHVALAVFWLCTNFVSMWVMLLEWVRCGDAYIALCAN